MSFRRFPKKTASTKPLVGTNNLSVSGTNQKVSGIDAKSTLTEDYLAQVCAQSYLGKKGYTIPKSVLSKEDQEWLRKELFVKPFVAGVNYGPEEVPFPVFRENANKFYIPRFYGIQRYGQPTRSEIEPGQDIDVPFVKPLRDYQDKIVDVYINHVQKDTTGLSACGQQACGGGILEVPCGRGKCLGKDTPILMYDGTIKLVQDIVVGDVIMGDDSGPRNILTLARGRETMYSVSSPDHDMSYRVNESHILSLITPDGTKLDMSVTEYLEHPDRLSLFGYRVPIEFPAKPLDTNPYIYSSMICIVNQPIADEYKYNSRKNRLDLLAGFIDCRGVKRNNTFVIKFNKTCVYINDILFVARSLGFTVEQTGDHKAIELIISGTQLNELPVYSCRRIEQSNGESIGQSNNCSYAIQLTKQETDNYYGFEIDGNRRFVLGDFTVTHNTVMALKIISILHKKTLIIVHKEFLMNQWIERIAEFLPSATVGKIQGPVFDITGKDIVIGMVQTLYDKEYAPETFACFGLTIIDEVHRIGSEQFSRTLFKTITSCMLGISATVDRKDKLTQVLHMFIGDKIYTENRASEDTVCVRAIEYVCQDSEFNEVEYDFRGNPKYSTMISKLCAFGPRSDFIVRVLTDLIEEEPENQIMILCHNRSLLTYLNEAINHHQVASVGFYVGGMKQKALQETEQKKIVLATYAMAAEALDIKTLSTLVMVTPKTDIIQSVGRILRVKHDNPIIVDIVDKHDLFRNQWAKRRAYFKKCDYRIRKISSTDYRGMCLDWETDRTWQRIYEPKGNGTSNKCTAPDVSKTTNEVIDGESDSDIEIPVIKKCMIDVEDME